MNYFYIILGIALVLIILIIISAFFRKKKISNSDKKYFYKLLKEIPKHGDVERQILEYDKLLDKVLHTRGYVGSLGEKLKENPHLFKDINGLWEAHKMRNKIAHEIDFSLAKTQAQKYIQIFKSNIIMLIDL